MDLLLNSGVTRAYVPLATNPVLDIDASRYVFTDDGVTSALHGDPVKRWTDVRSVAGDYATSGNFVQNTQVKRPIYRTNIFGNNPGIEFKTDDLLICTGADVAGRLTDSTYTMYAIVKFHLGSTSTQVICSMCKTTTLNAQYRLAVFLGATWALWRTDDSGTQTNLTTSTDCDNQAHLLTIQVNGTDAKMWIRSTGDIALTADSPNGTNASYGTTSITSYDNMCLGALKYNNTEGQFGDFYLGKLLIYNSVLSNADRVAIENDLIQQYL